MTNFEIVNFSSAEDLAKATASKWLVLLQDDRRRQSPYCVALSGGRIARQFFSAVTEQARSQKINWNGVHFFWGDERCVPPSDPESNFAIARDLLLQPLGIPETQIHRIRGEDPPEAAARNAAAELCSIAPLDPKHQPIINMIFLGMGEDGHVASLFPGEPENLIVSPAVYRAVVASKPPPRRITLGYSAIVAAREVWVLASGNGKKDALKESLLPAARTPLGRVWRSRTGTQIFTDIPVETG